MSRLKLVMFTSFLLLFSSCGLLEEDFEDPSPFLQYEATANIVGASPDSLQVDVLVLNQHRTNAIRLAHSACNVTVVLTSVDDAQPFQPSYACVALAISSTIDASSSKTFSFEMAVGDILQQGIPEGNYTVTATIRFTQLEQVVLSAGTVTLSNG